MTKQNSKVKKTERRRQEKRKLSGPTHPISQVVLSISSSAVHVKVHRDEVFNSKIVEKSAPINRIDRQIALAFQPLRCDFFSIEHIPHGGFSLDYFFKKKTYPCLFQNRK